ncbi:hypothetical protein KR009_010077 [Drosophila setifemur]|nr:hypothetical protein KR009_010077 [Drosophila setifemur]
MSVTRSVKSVSRRSKGSRLSTNETDLGPFIYCVNFYDNGIKALRDEFVKRIVSGMRRAVFVIDLDQEIADATSFNNLMNKTKKLESTNLKTVDPVEITLNSITSCVEEYARVTKIIEAEANFDLYQYWQKNYPAQLKNLTSKNAKNKGAGDTKRGSLSKLKVAKGQGTDKIRLEKINCMSVSAKEHHKVGKKAHSNSVYIRDNPLTANLFILIVGTMNNAFYMDLLAREQSLRAIVHFLPEESAYDQLVPRPRREQELQRTMEAIQQGTRLLRKRCPTKPVGIFQQRLPQMSSCMAGKFSDDVFDQLSWYMYDLESLREWYQKYYLDPFHMINVKMDPDVQLVDTFHMVESLSIQGHYLKVQMPAARNDGATIYLYMESLMSTFGNPRELMTETEVLLLANPTPAVQTRVLDKVKVYANAFKSILKLPKNDRIFVDQSNSLLSSLLSYMDQSLMRNVYHGCLEYNLMRRYFTSGYITNALNVKLYNGDPEPLLLPKFAQLYLTDDSVMQRIIELVNDYDDYTVEELHSNVRLYSFRRVLNEVFEEENQSVIPTQLCFRDFTLYGMERFLKDLVTPSQFEEMLENNTIKMESKATIANQGNSINVKCNSHDRFSIDPNVFVRPQSIKGDLAKRNKEKPPDEQPQDSGPKASFFSDGLTPKHNNTLRPSNKSYVSDTTVYDINTQPAVGLRANHPLLEGYNLDDTRQTIDSKTSKYFFEEGRVALYEEKWNFRQMNKCLSLEIDGQKVHFRSASEQVLATDCNVRIESKNGISLRVLPKEDECAKAVLIYPNGLTTYCQNTEVEHVWQYQENALEETRRVCTPHGCVVVFYQNSDTVQILRYNGEVYFLYSYTEDDNAEEEDMEFVNACSAQSTYSSFKPISTDKTKIRCSSIKTRSVGGSTALRPSTQSVISRPSLASRTSNAAARKSQLAKAKQYAALFASIEPELDFLKFIMGLYKLSYRHLKLVTSLGSVVHVQHDGKIWCGKPFRNSEWHDYHANESYSMRDDGVKMVWTRDEMRCYHSDGTVIRTGTAEGWDAGTESDDIDHEISSSSSHKKGSRSTSDEDSITMLINVPGGFLAEESAISLVKPKAPSITNYMVEAEEGEQEVVFDMSFITYTPSSHGMHHQIYASIDFSFTHKTKEDLDIETSIFTCDNLKLRVYKSSTRKEPTPSGSEDELKDWLNIPPEPVSSEADPDEWTKRRKPTVSELPDDEDEEESEKDSTGQICVEVECNNMLLNISSDRATIQTQLRKFGCDENARCGLMVRDDITLEVLFPENLAITFKKWIAKLTSFINCFCPKWRTTFFLTTHNYYCQKKGFELMKSIPPLGKFNFCAGNYFIDVNELKSVNGQFQNEFNWMEEDLGKFPRFPLQRKVPKEPEFPMVLLSKIFVEIPAQLANTDRIHQFVDEFDRIKFRKQRYRFNEAVMFHLHPRLRLLVQQEISKRSWKNHHAENRRRKFMEQQRLSLYMAMIKHKVYPKYFQFRDQFYCHVRNIDFFQFMTAKCNEKVRPEEPQVDAPGQAVLPEIPANPRKKCLCPKYTKIMKKVNI